MDSVGITSAKGPPLSLSSLRLLVPPLQLLSASMWRVLQRHDVMRFWEVSEFVSLVKETVPDLLLFKHWTQLNLGLRARFVLELCRREERIDCELIQSYLEKMKVQQSTEQRDSEEVEAEAHVLKVINAFLKDNQERKEFFQEVFPEEYGPDYDSDLQMLFWEFLCRLEQLLPVPELQQTVSWLGDDGSSIFEDCMRCTSEPTHVKDLLRHHKGFGHLEQHVPPSCMGDRILSALSALSAAPQSRQTEHEKQRSQLNLPQVSSQDPQPVTFVEDVAMEIITVTEYAEVELGASTDVEVIMEDKTHICTVAGDETVVVISENVRKDVEESGEKRQNGTSNLETLNAESRVARLKTTSGRHGCPDCGKKFRFASSLVAHRVIHTGERPHECSECGRCFSFRQSLERHKIGKRYECEICGERFPSVAACSEYKRTHVRDGVCRCEQRNKKFNSELALAKHAERHTGDNGNEERLESDGVQEVVTAKKDGVEAAKTVAEESKKAKSERDAPEVGAIDLQLMNEVISLVKVRTSGRKRKPTMKVQMRGSQKKTGNKTRKEAGEVKAPEMKPEPLNSIEPPYGTSMPSSKGDEVSVTEDPCSADFCPKSDHSAKEQVLQNITESHATKEEEGRFSCSGCDKTFKFLSVLKSHQRIHTGEQPYLCPQCGQRFSFKQSLERHKLTHKSGRNYECLICGEFFKSVVTQREHSRTHMLNGEYICTACGRTFAWKSALVRHLKTHGLEKSEFKCAHCELDFNCASSLSRHLQTHQEERVHECNCGKTFAHKTALTAHQRIHLKDKPHVCSQCGKGFLHKGGLLSHLKIHSQEMPFMCSYCGKSFKRERNMKKHERCHTRENVFQCSQCEKSFVYKATLVRHELTHSGERPFLCADCGKGFFSHAELLKHERFHTGHRPFECPHCGKKFTQSCYLTVHLRYHTGARPYPCSECDKSFLSANRLKRHQRTHTGEKPYVCGECGKGFRQSYHLKMHQRTHALKLT